MDTNERLPSILDLIHLGSVWDAEGRTLYESKAPNALQALAPARLVPCDFADSPSRVASGRPLRHDAYEQVRAHFDEVLWCFQVLRELHEEATGAPAHALAEVRKVCTMAQSVPRYLRAVHHFERPAPRDLAQLDEYRLPAPAAVLFKSIVGITSLIDHVLGDEAALVALLAEREAEAETDGAARVPPDARPRATGAHRWTAEDLLWVAEARGLLVGPREVCAAPGSMIVRTLRTLLEGRAGSACPAALEPILLDRARFLRFSAAATGATGEIRKLKQLSGPLVEVLRRELEAQPALLLSRADFKKLARRIERYFALERAALVALAQRQSEMLALFGASDPKRAPRITPADIDARVFARNPRALLAERHPHEARYVGKGVTLRTPEGQVYELEL